MYCTNIIIISIGIVDTSNLVEELLILLLALHIQLIVIFVMVEKELKTKRK